MQEKKLTLFRIYTLVTCWFFVKLNDVKRLLIPSKGLVLFLTVSKLYILRSLDIEKGMQSCAM